MYVSAYALVYALVVVNALSANKVIFFGHVRLSNRSTLCLTFSLKSMLAVSDQDKISLEHIKGGMILPSPLFILIM